MDIFDLSFPKKDSLGPVPYMIAPKNVCLLDKMRLIDTEKNFKYKNKESLAKILHFQILSAFFI